MKMNIVPAIILLSVVLSTASSAQGPPDIEWMAGGHSSPIRKSAIDPNGQFLAATSGPGPVQIWSLPGGQLLRTLNITPYAKAIALSNDGQILAVANALQNRIELWQVSSWTLQRSIPIPTYAYDMVFSSDDQYVVVGHSDGIRFWRVADGALWKYIARGFGESLSCIAISPNGEFVAASSSWGGEGAVLTVARIRWHENEFGSP